jgi:hypothetical protein
MHDNAVDSWASDTGYIAPQTTDYSHPDGPPGWLVGLGIAAGVVVLAVIVVVTIPADLIVAAGAGVVAGVVALGSLVAVSDSSSHSRMS